MKKTFIKNIFRDIKKTISRFLSIVVIIAVGVAFYAGVRATSPDMKMSGDYYLTESKFMDYRIVSTLGLTDNDISEIARQNGISEVEGAFSMDAVFQKERRSLVLNIKSLPPENGLNKLRIVDGKMAENDNEAVVEDRFLKENSLKLGDEIVLESGKDTGIEAELKNNKFVIVGAAQSPLYISLQRQLSSVGNGSVKGFVYIPKDVFTSDVYTDVYLKIVSNESQASMLKNEEYKKITESIETNLEELGISRSKARYEEIINQAQSKIDEAQEKLNLAKKETSDRFTEGYKQLNDMKSKFDQSNIESITILREIDENIEKLKYEEEKANVQIKDGQAEIQKSRDKLKEIKEPEWYILGRSKNVGYETYRQDSDRIGNIGKSFPLIFFLVAALVSLTTMTRLVLENRTEIGTFKALGYSRLSIVAHYLIYSVAASLTGSLIGVSFAFKLFPPLIMNAYTSLYTIPDLVSPFNIKLALEASLVSILFTTLATVAATLEELREVPAALMRPKPPKSGKTILLERATFIWKRLSFSKKVTARNILRYKQRFFMTVIGIAACTGLMISGFGIKGGIVGATQNQFNRIYKYDILTNLNKDIDFEYKNVLRDSIMEDTNFKDILFTYSKNGSVKDKNSGSQDIFIIVPENSNELDKYINLEMKGKDLNLLDDSIVITEKLSGLTNKKAGDTIELTLNDKVVKAQISAVTEHYIQHYIYISPQYYQEITGADFKYNGFYGLLEDTSELAEDDTARTLKNIENIGSISYKNNIHIDYNNSMNSINSVVFILIISAGVLAFVVIYNLTNININERKRELATIKLLGFYNNELASYIYKENIILTIIGSLTGVAVGIFLNKLVLNAAETNILMFLKTVEPIYFLYSVLLTITFSIVVNLAMYRKFDKIDMIESLKSAE